MAASSAARSVPADVQGRAEGRGRLARRACRRARRASRSAPGPSPRKVTRLRLRRSPPRPCRARSAGRRRCRRCRGSARPRPCSGWRPARSGPRAARRVDLVPEVAPRLGIDPGGGLVEQQQVAARAGWQAASARRCFQPPESSPASWLAARRSGPGGPAPRRPARRRSVEAVDAGHELQVLGDGQVLVERELLGHVAGAPLDLARPGRGCRSPGTSPSPQSGRQQAAEHAQAWWSCPSRWGRGSRRSGPASTWIETS